MMTILYIYSKTPMNPYSLVNGTYSFRRVEIGHKSAISRPFKLSDNPIRIKTKQKNCMSFERPDSNIQLITLIFFSSGVILGIDANRPKIKQVKKSLKMEFRILNGSYYI